MALSNGPNLGLLVNGNQGEAHYAELMKLLRGIDGLVMPSVKDKDLTAPPGSPADGDRYIVASGATGAWAGHIGKIARWSNVANSWEFYVPKAGWYLHVDDEAVFYKYDGVGWVVASGGGGGGGVTSVFGRTGAVTAQSGDYAISQISGAGSMAQQNSNNVSVTGGAVDGTPVGSTTPAAGKFTTVEASSVGFSADSAPVGDSAAGPYITFSKSANTTRKGSLVLAAKRRIVAATNLMARWGFNGDATDTSGNGHDATPVGSPTYITGPSQLGSVQAINLDGSTQWLTATGHSDFDLTATDCTVCFWGKPVDSTFGRIIGYTIDHGIGYGSAWGAQYFYLSWYPASDFKSNDLKPDMTYGNWYHFAVTREHATNTVKFYLNAVQKGSASANGIGNANNPFYIGRRGYGELVKSGVCDLRIYKRVLTLTELQLLANGDDDGTILFTVFDGTAETEVGRITPDGNFLWGTTTDDGSKFHINGNVRINATTSGSATAGAATLPANPVGFFQLNIGGTNYKVPYYNV